MQQLSKILAIATIAIVLVVGFSYAAPLDHFALAKKKVCKEGSKGDIKADKKNNDDAKAKKKKKGGKGKKPKPTASCDAV